MDFFSASALTTLIPALLSIPFICTLLVAIFTSRKLRQTLRHLAIASLTVGDLLVCSLYSPILAAFSFSGSPTSPNCAMAVASPIFMLTILAGSWGLLLQHVYYLLALRDVKPRGLSARAASCLRVVACLVPWLLAVAIYLALLLSSWSTYGEDGCRHMILTYAGYLSMQVVGVYFPLGLSGVLTVASIALYVSSRRQPTSASSALLAPAPHPIEPPLALNLATVTNLLFLLVPNAVYYYVTMTNNHTETILIVSTVTGALVMLKSVVMPLVWLANRNVRERVALTICCRCRHDNDDDMEKHELAGNYRSLEGEDLTPKAEIK